MTWSGREDMERHVSGCWHCLDHFCRMAKVIELLRGLQPLDESEAAPLRKLLGVEPPRKSDGESCSARSLGCPGDGAHVGFVERIGPDRSLDGRPDNQCVGIRKLAMFPGVMPEPTRVGIGTARLTVRTSSGSAALPVETPETITPSA